MEVSQHKISKINIAFLHFRSSNQAWERLLIEKIIGDDSLNLSLIIDCIPEEDTSEYDKTTTYLYKKVVAFDRKRFRVKQSAIDTVILEPTVELSASRLALNNSQQSPQISNHQINEIEAFNLDVILAFGKGPLLPEIAKCAKFGIWTHELTTAANMPSFEIGFQEMIGKKPTAASGLFAFLSNGNVYPLYTSTSSTEGISLHKVFDRIYWKMPAFFPRTLKSLALLGENKFHEKYFNKPVGNLFNQSQKKQEVSIFSSIVRYFKNFFFWKIKNKVVKKKWIILFHFANDNNSEIVLDFNAYTKITPPKGEFWADPFVINKGEKYYVFFEACSLKSRSNGNISLITIDESGKISSPTIVLKKTYHLSYPFLFHWDNNWYMIPETAQNRNIELYKCIKFPDQWEFQYNLMEDINAVDTTLFFHGNKWWLFVNIKENSGASSWDELYLYYADNPLSKKWQPHALNPIVSDVTSSRPAGNIFQKDGKLYRPSQNSAYYYGYGLKINEIITLNEIQYEEKTINSIKPDWDSKFKAIHTYNQVDKLTVIDAIWQDNSQY